MHGDGALKENVAQLSKFALQAQVQVRWFERARKELGSNKAMFVIPAPSCACAIITDFPQTEEEKGYSQFLGRVSWWTHACQM